MADVAGNLFPGMNPKSWTFGAAEQLYNDPNWYNQASNYLDARAPFAQYARSLRPAIDKGLSSIPLAATMSQAADMGGLDASLRDAVSTSGTLQTIREANALADALQQTRTDIQITEAQMLSAVPKAPSIGMTVASGAASGAAVAGPWGALAGGAAGLIQGISARRSSGDAKDAAGKRAAQAFQALSPSAITDQLATAAPVAREQVLSGGYGNLISQDLQAALSQSGLRDSALGQLAGVAGAAAPEQLARSGALSLGLTSTRQRIETILGNPVTRPKPDRLTEALGVAAEGYLTYKALFPTKAKTTSGSLLPGPEDMFKTPPPQFQIPDPNQFLPRG